MHKINEYQWFLPYFEMEIYCETGRSVSDKNNSNLVNAQNFPESLPK